MSNSDRDMILSLLVDRDNLLMRTAEELLSLISSGSSSDDSTSQDSSPDEELVAIDERLKSDLCVKKIDAYSDKEFSSNMRMRRETANFLIEKYSGSVAQRTHGGGRIKLDPKLKMYIYIWYIGNTDNITQLGDIFGVAKSSAWAAVCEVTSWFISIGHEYVKWPQGAAAEENKMKFLTRKNMPGVIGVIGCIRVRIKAPKVNKRHYYNRLHGYSLVLQGVVDADMKFIDITCGGPGSLEDSDILFSSDLYSRIQTDCSVLFPDDSYIVGDSTYPSTSWLVPPLDDCGSLKQQREFNELHLSTRIVVENAFGLLKTRFRRFSHLTDLTNLSNIINILVSACVVHNICIIFDDLDFEEGTIPLKKKKIEEEEEN